MAEWWLGPTTTDQCGHIPVLTFRSFRRSSSDVLSMKTFPKSSIFPVNSLRVGVHRRVYGKIERNVREFQSSVSTKIAAWRPGDYGTFVKL